MRSFFYQIAGGALTLLAAGCGSGLHHETTMSVAPTELKTLAIDPTTREQKVRVQASAPGTPVNVYCFLQKDQREVEKSVEAGRASDKILASALNREEADLTVTVPANTAAVVLLTRTSGKAASVKVKIDGQ